MPTFAFEVMSPGQAAAFAVTDNLVIATPLTQLTDVGVSLSGADVTFSLAGRSLTFGSAFTSQVRSLRPASTTQGTIIVGTPGGDFITGLSPGPNANGPGDAIYGGAGDDTIDGAVGSDTIAGGAGADVFVIRPVNGRDVITDFQVADKLGLTGPVPDAGHYQESAFATELAANLFAQGEVRSGRADVLAAQVGPDVIVYFDFFGNDTAFGQVFLRNIDLSSISLANFIAAPPAGAPVASPPPVDAPPPLTPAAVPTPAPVAPAAPPVSVNIKGQSGTVTGSMDNLHFSSLQGATVNEATLARYDISKGPVSLLLGGSLNNYDSHQLMTDGQVGFVRFITPDASFLINVSVGVRMTSLGFWIENDRSLEAFTSILVFDDSFSGSPGSDLIRSFGGNDLLVGGGGGDTLWGGTGDDIIYATNQPGVAAAAGGTTYLRGEEGSDYITGATGFDDANGNQGNDTVTTGAGDDYCVGGKDDDLLFGDAGQDFVYGNLGNDTCEGGDGNDIVRGGQNDDIVRGGAGDDFVSGDKGDDTMTGGTGADLFHTFGDAGMDLVTDFNFAEGDRVVLDPGTQYTLTQSGTTTVIAMVGGGTMLLVNTALASLSPGWIFGA